MRVLKTIATHRGMETPELATSRECDSAPDTNAIEDVGDACESSAPKKAPLHDPTRAPQHPMFALGHRNSPD